MDLLLDVNIALDICAQRKPYAEKSALALEIAKSCGVRIWLYCGSIQTLEYNLYKVLKRDNQTLNPPAPNKTLLHKARNLLVEFVKDKHWLAALAEEGPVFHAFDPEDEQLIRALERFPAGTIKLLTRDDYILTNYPEKTIAPEDYCQLAVRPNKIDFIDLKTQQDHIRPQLEQNLHRVLHHGQYIMGPEVKQLEEKLSEYTSAKYCITVASGTEALLISLMALGVRAGDEVITTPFTFVATAEVIVLLGAKPVFVDIEPDTCNIDASKIEAAITQKTKAIMPVSLYGQPADMDEINVIANKYNLPVIEDAAQSFGATYKGRKSCNLSTIGCTSFFPSKPLGCYGDGGAIFTSDENIAQACREIRVHGQSKRYIHTRIGVGGRMDTLQCAIVLAKLQRFDWEVEQRIIIGQRYNQLLDAAGIQRVQQRSDRNSVFGQYTLFKDNREPTLEALKQAGIPTAVHYPVPLHQQPAYQNYVQQRQMRIAETVAQRVVSLPMGSDLSLSSQQLIVATLAYRK